MTSLNKKANHIARNPVTGADIKSLPTPAYQQGFGNIDWSVKLETPKGEDKNNIKK